MKTILDYGRAIFSFDIREVDNRVAIAAQGLNSGTELSVFDLSNNEQLFTLTIHHFDMFAMVKFVTRNKIIALIKQQLVLINIESGEKQVVGSNVLQVEFGMDKATFMILRSNPLRLEILDLESMKLNRNLELKKYLSDADDNLFRFTISSKLLVVAGPEIILIYDLNTLSVIRIIDHPAVGINSISVDINSEYICFLGLNFKGSYLYSVIDGKSRATLGLFSDQANGFSAVSFLPTSEHIVFGRQQGECSGYNYDPDTYELFDKSDHDNWVSQISFSIDLQSMLTSGHDGKIVKYNLNELNENHPL